MGCSSPPAQHEPEHAGRDEAEAEHPHARQRLLPQRRHPEPEGAVERTAHACTRAAQREVPRYGGIPADMKRIFLTMFTASLLFMSASRANAGNAISVRIILSSQRMLVSIDGEPTYSWVVSTARRCCSQMLGTHLGNGCSSVARGLISKGRSASREKGG